MNGKARKRGENTREGETYLYGGYRSRTVSLSKLETEGRTLGGMVAHLVMDSEDRRVG